MDPSDDKHWAQRYLLDPLNEADPSQETGPGSSFRPDSAVKTSAETETAKLQSPPTPPTSPSSKLNRNPYRRRSSMESKRAPGMISSIVTSPAASSKSPTTTASELPNRSNTISSHSRNTSGSNTFNPFLSSPVAQSPNSPNYRQDSLGNLNKSSTSNGTPGRVRGSSLTSRFPGDKSNEPLAVLAEEKRRADRSSHMVKKHHIQPDTIDALDNIGGASYHHSGPYDATLYARNNSYLSSPVAAVAGTNAEALKATPKEKIIDSVKGHRPLDGVASFPPGSMDRNGHLYEYEEGDNMMIGGGHEPEGGAYKRWPGIQYAPGDIKGKGEPSYTIEKNLKEAKGANTTVAGDAYGGIEMTSQASGDTSHRRNFSGNLVEGDASVTAVGRSGSFRKRLSGGLQRRIGSVKNRSRGDSIGE